MLFKGHSSRLEMLIEKMHSNKETNFQDTDVSGGSSSPGPEEPLAGQNFSDSALDRTNSVSSISINMESPKSEPYSDSDESLDVNQDYSKSDDTKCESDNVVQIKTEPLDSQDSQFTCEFCPRLFKHKRSRDRHVKLHTGDKKYKCLQCESAFARSDHLKIHLKTHDVKKQYKCLSCNKGYNTASALSFHEQSHIKDKEGGSDCSSPNSQFEKSLICFHCSETFSTSDLLQNHLLALDSSEVGSEIMKDAKSFCIYCYQEFPNVTIMYDHVQICHRTVKNEISNSDSAIFKSSTPNFQQDIYQDFNISMTVQNISIENRISAPSNNLVKRRKDEVLIENTTFKRKCYEESSSTPNIGKTFICACCYKQLPNFKSFLLHMETHVTATKSDVTGSCVVCNQQISLNNLSKHMFEHSVTQLQNYVCCCVCTQYFKDYNDLQTHLAKEHVQNVYRCSICKEMFEEKAEMQEHLNSVHTLQRDHFECNFCTGTNKVFHDRPSAEDHIAKCHLEQLSFKRAHSPNYLKTNGEGNLKMENDVKLDFSTDESAVYKTGLLSLQCAYCKELCKTKNELQIHLKGHQILEKTKHKCNICDEVYVSANKLANHKLIHCKIVEGNICVQCKLTLKDTDTFFTHQLKHNNSSKSSSKFLLPSICVVCSQTLQSNMEIELHAKFHLKFLSRSETNSLSNNNTVQNSYTEINNPYQYCSGGQEVKFTETLEHHCYLCKKSFETNEILQAHLIEHNFFGMNQFSCYVCSSVFTAASGLQSHLLQHNLTEKPYQCSKCQKTFFFRAELDNHKFSHRFQVSYNILNENKGFPNIGQESSNSKYIMARPPTI